MNGRTFLPVALLGVWAVFITRAQAQVFPADGDTLTYTSVCFAFPGHTKAESYSVALIDEAKPKDVVHHLGAGNKIIVNGLLYGHTYTWFVVSKSANGEPLDVTDPTRFSIAPLKSKVRYTLMTNDLEKRSNTLLLPDYTRSAINREGETVWYLPRVAETTSLRDLRLTDDGTITAIIDSMAVEMDLRGHILWKAPTRGKTRADYRHSFAKLPSGNYIGIGCDYKRYAVPGRTDSALVDVGTVVEFTPDGKISWQWNGRDFFKPEWIAFQQKNDGTYIGSVHPNAVAADAGFVYVGFRDAGWILKIRRTTKKVEAIYGGRNSGLSEHYGQGLFRYQHDVCVLKDGSLAVINNDSVADPKVVSSALIFSQGKSDAGAKLFEFPFNFDGTGTGKSVKLGSICELPNGNLLINMGTINRILEVTRDKKVVWDAWVEKYDDFKKVWEFFPQYHVATASSLYPNEFCVKSDGGWDKKGWTGSITVVNVGSETNTFSIWTEKKGKPVWVATTAPVAPGAKHRQMLRVPGQHHVLTIQVEGKSKREKLTLPQNSTVF